MPSFHSGGYPPCFYPISLLSNFTPLPAEAPGKEFHTSTHSAVKAPSSPIPFGLLETDVRVFCITGVFGVCIWSNPLETSKQRP